MKEKLKIFLKIKAILIGIYFVTFSCTNDDFRDTNQEQVSKKLDFVGYVLPTDSIFKSKPILKNQVINNFPNKPNELSKTLTSETFGFSIDTTEVMILRSDNFDSYTFTVERENNDITLLENYVVTYYSNNRYTQFLIGYPIIEDDYGNISYNISAASISSINDNTLLIQKSECSSYAQEWQPGECFYVACGGSTGSGDHYPGMRCNADPGDQPYYWCEPGIWLNTFCVQYFTDVDGNGGGPSGGSNSSGSSPNNDDDDNEVEFPTVPFNNYNEFKNNCKELNKLTSPPAYPESNPYTVDGSGENIYGLNTKVRLAIINADHQLDNDVETGFGLYNAGNYLNTGPYAHYVPANGTHHVNFPTKSFQFGTIHTHPANSTNGNWIPMFSLDDIYSMLQIRNTYTSNSFLNDLNTAGDALFTSILVVKQGDEDKTYAIKIDDVTEFQKLQDVMDDFGDANGDGIDEYDDLNKELRDSYIQEANNVDGTSTQYQTVLLKFLKNNDLGVSLFEMEQTNPGTPQVQETWKKLELGDFDTVTASPCNN